MALNPFKIEQLEAMRDNIEVMANNLKYSQRTIENLIRDEFRQNGVAVEGDRTAPQVKEVTEIAGPTVAQIEAPKDAATIQVVNSEAAPAAQDGQVVASTEQQPQPEPAKPVT